MLLLASQAIQMYNNFYQNKVRSNVTAASVTPAHCCAYQWLEIFMTKISMVKNFVLAGYKPL